MEWLLAFLSGVLGAMVFGFYCDYKHDKECERIQLMSAEEYKKYLEETRKQNHV